MTLSKKHFISLILIIPILVVLPAPLVSEAVVFPFAGLASWYADFSPGVRQTTANMEIFDHNAKTCALWGVPFNTMIEVTNLRNGRKVIVRVNDRGPAKRFVQKGRVIDLTKRAFEEIANLDEGLISVGLRIIE